MNQLVKPIKEFNVEHLKVFTYQNRKDIETAAGKIAATRIRD